MRCRIFPLAIISLFTPICFVALHTPHSTQAGLVSGFQQDRVPKEVPAEGCPVAFGSAVRTAAALFDKSWPRPILVRDRVALDAFGR
jgi:hypothetical protein